MKSKMSFSEEQVETLKQVMLSRRDVRGNHFLGKEVEEDKLLEILQAGVHAPSVGYSQPWEFVVVNKEETKQQIKANFEEDNAKAAAQFPDEKRALYQGLKLEGITEAPVNLAVFYKPSGEPVLGQQSMEEMGRYSVVCAIQNMWLMARALNIGMGWISILNPEGVKKILHAPVDRELVGYFALGYVEEFLGEPELESVGWATRKPLAEVVKFGQYRDQ